MVDHFESAKRTLKRADHHISDLEIQIDAFTNEQTWSYFVEKDADGFHNLHKIRFTRKLPDDLPSILFDAANNLRATLDQMGYAAAVASGKVAPKQTQFPFGDDLDGLNNVIRRGRCRDLPPEILALFEATKPYKGGNDALWALNKLCNSKKHCALIPFVTGRASLRLEVLTEGKPAVTSEGLRLSAAGFYGLVSGSIGPLNNSWDPAKNELLLLKSEPKPNVSYEPNVTCSVAIGVLPDHPAVTVLRKMRQVVYQIGSATEEECRRIRLI